MAKKTSSKKTTEAPKRQAKTAAALLEHLRSTGTGKSKIEAGAAWLKQNEGASAATLLEVKRDVWPHGTCRKAEAFIDAEAEPAGG